MNSTHKTCQWVIKTRAANEEMSQGIKPCGKENWQREKQATEIYHEIQQSWMRSWSFSKRPLTTVDAKWLVE